MSYLETLYQGRFSEVERRRKDALWRVLCASYLQRFVRPDDTLLDLASGLGEFCRHIRAGHKIAVDLNPEAGRLLPAEVEFHAGSAERLDFLAPASVDVCFSSNFLEHLPSKAVVDAVLAEVVRVLKPGGRYVAIQPNVRYQPGAYWDFWDHHTPLTHLSCAEAFHLAGLAVERLVPRFLPATTKTRLPVSPGLLRLYLAVPLLWPIAGKQFLIVGRKPIGAGSVATAASAAATTS